MQTRLKAASLILESTVFYPINTNNPATQAPDCEAALLRRCMDGDAQAQYTLYDRYVVAMYNAAIRIVVRAEMAEDVLQEAFSRIFQQLHTFRGDASLGAWIKRIVVNTALQHLRKKNQLKFVAIDHGADWADEPCESVESWDAATLHNAIKALPDGCRVVFTLYVVENMGHKAIAEALGISESTSKTQYMRAKKLLKAHLLKIPLPE